MLNEKHVQFAHGAHDDLKARLAAVQDAVMQQVGWSAGLLAGWLCCRLWLYRQLRLLAVLHIHSCATLLVPARMPCTMLTCTCAHLWTAHCAWLQDQSAGRLADLLHQSKEGQAGLTRRIERCKKVHANLVARLQVGAQACTSPAAGVTDAHAAVVAVHLRDWHYAGVC